MHRVMIRFVLISCNIVYIIVYSILCTLLYNIVYDKTSLRLIGRLWGGGRGSSGTNATEGAAGPTPPGEHRRIRINHTKITPGCTRDASGRTRTHQDTSSITTDNTRTHRTTQDLKRQTEGEPGPGEEDYSQLETPATGKASPPAHTQLRIARTNETKRFPGCLTPQPPI